MSKRKQFTPEQKVAIVRRHLVEKVPVSDLCDEFGMHANQYYNWQKQLFENAAPAFARRPNSANEKRRQNAAEKKLQLIEKKLQDRNEVVAELLQEHVRTSPYYPQSNGKLERYHRPIKGDCIRPGTPLTLEDARRLVAGYVEQYNEVRLHSALGYVAPADKLHGRESEIFAARDAKLQEARRRRAASRQRAKASQKCYIESACAEDRATMGTDPSAASGLEAEGRRSRIVVDSHFCFESNAINPRGLGGLVHHFKNTAFSPSSSH